MTATAIIIVLLAIILVLNVAFIIYYISRAREARAGESEGLGFLQKEIQNLRESFDTKIGDSTKEINASVQRQLGESTKIVREVTEGLTKLGETNKQVIGFADQLKQLQDVLKNPKQRGVLGEYYLETVLKNVLPPESYKMQYAFKNNEIVDAVVFVKDKVVPIDSKFSLENYNRLIEAEEAEKPALEKAFVNDLKLRITETAKYINPPEGTTDFAFMFIPSEGIYYDLLTNKVGSSENENLIQRAAGKYKVIIVSPTSFLAYLQTVLQGLKAMQIEETAQDIIKNVEKLGNHIGKYEEYYEKLGNTLTTTVNHYNAGYKELGKVDKDVLRITGENAGIEVQKINRPHKED